MAPSPSPQFISNEERKALSELLPFRANRPQEATAQTLPQVCKNQLEFVLRLPKLLTEGFCIVIKRVGDDAGDDDDSDDGELFLVLLRLNVDQLEEMLRREFPDQLDAIATEAHQYLATELGRRQLDRLYGDPSGTPPPTPYYPSRQGRRHCKFSVPEIHILDRVLDGTYAPSPYFLLVRDKCFRDLLLVPDAQTHASNNNTLEMIADPVAWQAILTVASKVAEAVQLPETACFVEFRANFGNWEGLTHCLHGHDNVHLLLTRQGASLLGSTHSQFVGFLDVPQDDGHLIECRALQARLTMDRLSGKIDGLAKEIAALSKEMKQDIAATKQDIAALSKETSDNFARILTALQGAGFNLKTKAEAFAALSAANTNRRTPLHSLETETRN